jgi:hypothetical protein
MEAYWAAGAKEPWIVFPRAKRFEFYSADGLRDRTSFKIDLVGLFD